MLATLVDLVLPARCVGCDRPGPVLCRACGSVERLADTVDLRAGPAGQIVVYAAASYGGPIRTALIAYKERGRRDLARPLGELLASALPPGRTCLVPVPSSPAARRARGGDHVARLARVAARRRGPAPVVSALRLVRAVEDSAGLGAASRAANVRQAMRAAGPRGQLRSAVIVDDIVTTGATLLEAARALNSAGWRVDGAAVVAATPRRADLPSARTGPSARLAGRTARGLP
jgi:predicted amidophosphoribosyltransferase